jgi:hypothetical protein
MIFSVSDEREEDEDEDENEDEDDEETAGEYDDEDDDDVDDDDEDNGKIEFSCSIFSIISICSCFDSRGVNNFSEIFVNNSVFNEIGG